MQCCLWVAHRKLMQELSSAVAATLSTDSCLRLSAQRAAQKEEVIDMVMVEISSSKLQMHVRKAHPKVAPSLAKMWYGDTVTDRPVIYKWHRHAWHGTAAASQRSKQYQTGPAIMTCLSIC